MSDLSTGISKPDTGSPFRSKAINAALRYGRYCFRRVRWYVRDETGAEAIEWIAMAAVLVTLLAILALIVIPPSTGASIGHAIVEAIMSWAQTLLGEPAGGNAGSSLLSLVALTLVFLAGLGGVLGLVLSIRNFYQYRISDWTSSPDRLELEFGARTKRLASELSEALEAPYLHMGLSYRHLLVFILDAHVIFQDTNLPGALPVVYVRRRELLVEDMEDIKHLLSQGNIGIYNVVILVVLGREIEVQRSREMCVKRSRAVLGYDIVVLSSRDLQRLVLAPDSRLILRQLVLSQIDLLRASPYVEVGPAPDHMFFGRERELQHITDHACSMSHVIVSGRRVGKTSVMVRLHRITLPATGCWTIYHDCSTTPTFEAFCAAPILNWRPEIPQDAPGTLGDLLQAPSPPRPLVLLLDEADKLVPNDKVGGWRLLNLLRAQAGSGRVQIILSGERTLSDALLDPTGPLFNFADKIILGPLSLEATEELITRPMRQLGVVLVDTTAITQCIYDFTFGHPNVIQRFCRRLLEGLVRESSRRITLEDVERVAGDPQFQEKDFLATYWERATPLEQIISLLMAYDAKPYRLQSVLDMLAAHDLCPAPEVAKAALDRLVDLRSILKRTQLGYEFAVSAFPKVVANTITAEDLLIVLKSQYLTNPMELPE